MENELIALEESVAGWESIIRQVESGFGPDGKPVTPAVKRHGIEIAQRIIAKNRKRIEWLIKEQAK